jgi:aryl carrier-like protein
MHLARALGFGHCDCVGQVYFPAGTDADWLVVSRLQQLYLVEIGDPATPASLQALANGPTLSAVYLAHTSRIRVRDIVDAGLAHRIRQLGLLGTEFDESRAAGIAEFTNLEGLALEDVSVTDSIFQPIAKLDTLRNLELKNCRNIRGADWASLETLDRFTFFQAEGMTLDARAYAHLAQIPNLRAVALLGMQDVDAGLEQLADSDSLRSLDVSDSDLSDAGLDSIAQCSQLEELKINHATVSEAGLLALASLKNYAARVRACARGRCCVAAKAFVAELLHRIHRGGHVQPRDR